MVKISRSYVKSYKDESNPTGKRLEVDAYLIKEDGTKIAIRWLDINGDGKVTTGVDQYIQDRGDCISCFQFSKPKTVDDNFKNEYDTSLEQELSGRYAELIVMDNYFGLVYG